jgi:hypothetical protein
MRILIYHLMLKEYRVRIGQSKVPYGFENLQSSQNRLSLDRNDALNSAVVKRFRCFLYQVKLENVLQCL